MHGKRDDWYDIAVYDDVGYVLSFTSCPYRREGGRRQKTYLAEQYPDETYSIRTIPFRTDGFEHTNLYTIYVTFTDEPNAEYYYRVDEKNPISISGYTGDVRDFRLESTGEQVVVH